MCIDEQELPYVYVGMEQLVRDFRALILKHMGVTI